MATQQDVGAPFGKLALTSAHVFPPSRVTQTRPSSDPVHTTSLERGLSAIANTA